MKKLLKMKRIWLLLLFPAGYLALYFSKRSEFFAEEVMAKRVFKVLSVGISTLTGWIPFSLAELTVILAAVAAVILIVVFFVALVKNKGRRLLTFFSGVITAACIASVIYFGYVVGCGCNYYRTEIAKQCGLTLRPSEKQELYDLCCELAEEASTLRRELSVYEDENGAFKLPCSMKELGKTVRDAYIPLAKEYPILKGHYPAPKGIFFSRFFSRMELTGIFTCWTMEANFNTENSDYDIAATMAHELAHLRGFIREDEANFIACLACNASDSPIVRYSGKIMALIYCGNALAEQDMDLYGQLWQHYDAGIGRDFEAHNAYWEQFENTVISETADKVNDTYLKANDQEDGVKSYGRVVDLLLADYRKRHGLE